jgi:hypothetical protein
MVRFIKLTNMIINTNHINKIFIKPQKYYICLNNNYEIDGNILGSGTINTNDNAIEICETKNPVDYKHVSRWIQHLIFEW